MDVHYLSLTETGMSSEFQLRQNGLISAYRVRGNCGMRPLPSEQEYTFRLDNASAPLDRALAV